MCINPLLSTTPREDTGMPNINNQTFSFLKAEQKEEMDTDCGKLPDHR